MLVSVISFGSLWRRRFSKEPNAPQAVSRTECFTTRQAFAGRELCGNVQKLSATFVSTSLAVSILITHPA